MMKLNLAFLLFISAVVGQKTLELILGQICQTFEMSFFLGIQGMNVETTPAREVCQGFECPNDNEEGGLFQVAIYHSFLTRFPTLSSSFFLQK